MSRLVDADALREHIEDHVTSVSVCCTSQEAYGRTRMKMLALRDVDEAPTVDAIPVEWLEQQFYDNPKSQWAEKCRDVYTKWQKWQRWQKELEAR